MTGNKFRQRGKFQMEKEKHIAIFLAVIFLNLSLWGQPSSISLLHDAIKDGDKDRILELQQSGVDINTPNEFGWTLLMSAAYNGDLNMVEKLLEAEADPSHKSIYGKTALDLIEEYIGSYSRRSEGPKIKDMLTNAISNRRPKPESNTRDQSTVSQSTRDRYRAFVQRIERIERISRSDRENIEIPSRYVSRLYETNRSLFLELLDASLIKPNRDVWESASFISNQSFRATLASAGINHFSKHDMQVLFFSRYSNHSHIRYLAIALEADRKKGRPINHLQMIMAYLGWDFIGSSSPHKMELLKALHNSGVNLSKKYDFDGGRQSATMLMCAVTKGDMETVKFLVETAKVDVNILHDGQNALALAESNIGTMCGTVRISRSSLNRKRKEIASYLANHMGVSENRLIRWASGLFGNKSETIGETSTENTAINSDNRSSANAKNFSDGRENPAPRGASR